jgi:hypothetical protein
MTDADTVREGLVSLFHAGQTCGCDKCAVVRERIAALDALVADRDAWIKAAADNGAAQDAAEKERDRVLGAYHRENDGRLAAEAELEVEKKRLREMQPIMRLSDDLHAAEAERDGLQHQYREACNCWKAAEAEVARLTALGEWAVAIISNVSEGDLTQQAQEWQDAAHKWLDEFHAPARAALGEDA